MRFTVPLFTIAAVVAISAQSVLAAPYRTHDGTGYSSGGTQYHYEVWQHDNNHYELKVWLEKDYPNGSKVSSGSYYSSSGEALKAFDCWYTEKAKDRNYCR